MRPVSFIRWLFGIAERYTKRVLVVVVPNRKRVTLLRIMRQRVARGTHVYSDEFSSYFTLKQIGYPHSTVNHSKEEYVRYEDDGTLAHTNTVEGFWSMFKISLRGRRGTRRNQLESFARVRTWRSLGESIFSVVSAHTAL